MQTYLLDVSDDAGTKEHQCRFNSSCDICWNLQAGSCSSITTIAWQLLIEKETPDNHKYFRSREKTQIIGTFSFLDFLSVSMRHMRLTHRGEEMLLFLVTSVSSFVLCDLPECFDESVFALCNNE